MVYSVLYASQNANRLYYWPGVVHAIGSHADDAFGNGCCAFEFFAWHAS